MQIKTVFRGILCAAFLGLLAGIFSPQSFAATNTTPTSFSRSVKIAPTVRQNTANNEDGFFETLERQSKRDRRNRNRNEKVDDDGEEESRTQEIAETDRKGRRNRENRQTRIQRAQKLTAPSDASSTGVNE